MLRNRFAAYVTVIVASAKAASNTAELTGGPARAAMPQRAKREKFRNGEERM